MSRPAPDEVLSGKPVAIIGASSGRWGTRLAQAALRQVFYATESLVMPKPAVFLSEAARLFDESGRLVHAATRESLEAVLVAFAAWIERVAPPRREEPSARLTEAGESEHPLTGMTHDV